MLPSMLSKNAKEISFDKLADLNVSAAYAAKDMVQDYDRATVDAMEIWHDPTPKDTGRGEDVTNGSLWLFDGHMAWFFWDGTEWMADPDNDAFDNF